MVWRAGVDLSPLRPDGDDLRWQAALVWPGHQERTDRLRAAAAVVAADPPRIVTGDLRADLPALLDAALAGAPPAATVVVTHTSVLAYVDPDARIAFAATMLRLRRERGWHWLAAEGVRALPDAAALLAGDPGEHPGRLLIALDGRPLALAHPHGRDLRWLRSDEVAG